MPRLILDMTSAILIRWNWKSIIAFVLLIFKFNHLILCWKHKPPCNDLSVDFLPIISQSNWDTNNICDFLPWGWRWHPSRPPLKVASYFYWPLIF
jgi:hypothetical protein